MTPARMLCFASCLLASSFLFAQSEFSAEVVSNRHHGNAEPAKMYFGKDKLRIEGQDPNGHGGGTIILNMSTHTSVILMPQQHMYMEMPEEMVNQRKAYDFFRVHDVENACSDWLAQERNKGGSCHKVGTETVNGRSTVKYEGTNAEGKSGAVWIDPKLQFPVKWQDKGGSGGELRNIQEASQPSSLFEVPAGYTKFDMGNMKRPQ